MDTDVRLLHRHWEESDVSGIHANEGSSLPVFRSNSLSHRQAQPPPDQRWSDVSTTRNARRQHVAKIHSVSRSRVFARFALARRGKPESPGEGEPLFWGRLMFLLCSCGAWRCRTCQPLVHNSSEFSTCSTHVFGQFLEGFHRVDRDEAIFTTKIWTEVLEVHNLFIAKSGIRCQDASKTYNLSIGIEGTSSMVVVKGWQSLPQNQASASLMTRISAL
ncbi:hypothetical protein CABS01_16289 [Colletotrichum abscissum]|uniref:uncharacterized protein n=1 Tax=Colletotrichum abscissum TaxID=1671311 RepID=UPI0027D4D45A|nr:uncharacterized protein CABS01_16289 [Colletotrichum abscissum]KAK1471701.1 hypothetical protein CABS01_16289 [Colletotrichum abscissum]